MPSSPRPMLHNVHTHTHTHTQSQCAQHSATACTTCKRLRRTAEACCALGHHADDHIARRPQQQLCPLHGLPPCPRCTLKQRGVCHCCQRGHHKVCTGAGAPEAPTYTVATAQQTTTPARVCTYLHGSAEVPTPTPHPSGPQTQEAEVTPPSVPASPSSTGAGGDRGRGCRTPAFRDEARESKHSGYLASKIQRF